MRVSPGNVTLSIVIVDLSYEFCKWELLWTNLTSTSSGYIQFLNSATKDKSVEKLFDA